MVFVAAVMEPVIDPLAILLDRTSPGDSVFSILETVGWASPVRPQLADAQVPGPEATHILTRFGSDNASLPGLRLSIRPLILLKWNKRRRPGLSSLRHVGSPARRTFLRAEH
jgi:hypothetical protein